MPVSAWSISLWQFRVWFHCSRDLGERRICYLYRAKFPFACQRHHHARAVTDTTKSVSASVTITGPQPISVSFASAPPTSLVVNTTASVAATVANDPKNAGVTWSLNCGSSSCGSISPTTSASGASVTYTAPSAVPSPATVTITATSVTDTTKVGCRNSHDHDSSSSGPCRRNLCLSPLRAG